MPLLKVLATDTFKKSRTRRSMLRIISIRTLSIMALDEEHNAFHRANTGRLKIAVCFCTVPNRMTISRSINKINA